jgi:hypothetical protein
MRKNSPIDPQLLAAHLPEFDWPHGGAYPPPSYPIPQKIELAKRGGAWVLEWEDAGQESCGSADRVMRDLLALVWGDKEEHLRFAQTYGVPIQCYAHASVGSEHSTTCDPCKPFPIEIFRQQARAFGSLWQLFAQFRLRPERQKRTRGDYWTGARGFTPGQAGLVSRLMKATTGEDLPYGRVQRLIQEKPSRAEPVLRAYMRSRLHQYGFSYSVGAGALSDPESLRPVPVLPGVMATAYFKLLLTVTNTRRANLCAICGEPFVPSKSDRTYCYADECGQEMRRQRMRRHRAARD